MRLCFCVAAAAAMAGSVLYASPVRADDLTGKMALYNYLTAKPWNCTISFSAMGDMPAHTDQATATFVVVPGNVMHDHVQSPMFVGDFYFGYSEPTNSYWQADANNMSFHTFLTSSDGRTYSGTASLGPSSMQDTTTYSKLASDRVTVHEVTSGGPMAATYDTICTQERLRHP